MRVEVHVKSVDEIADAKAKAEQSLSDGDELVVIVAQPHAPLLQERKAAR